MELIDGDDSLHGNLTETYSVVTAASAAETEPVRECCVSAMGAL